MSNIKRKVYTDAVSDTETSALMQYKINQKDKQLDDWCSRHNLRRDYSRELVSEQVIPTDYNVDKSGKMVINSVSLTDKKMYSSYKDKLGNKAPETIEK